MEQSVAGGFVIFFFFCIVLPNQLLFVAKDLED